MHERACGALIIAVGVEKELRSVFFLLDDAIDRQQQLIKNDAEGRNTSLHQHEGEGSSYVIL